MREVKGGAGEYVLPRHARVRLETLEIDFAVLAHTLAKRLAVSAPLFALVAGQVHEGKTHSSSFRICSKPIQDG